MRKSGLRTTYTVIVCFILTLLILPCAGKTYAQGYTIVIAEPALGTTVSSPELTVQVIYSLPPGSVSCDVDTYIRLVALEGEAPGQGNSFEETRFYGGYNVRSSGTWTFSKNINDIYWSPWGPAPAGEYEINAYLKRGLGQEVMALAGSTFYYKTAAQAATPDIVFTPDPAKVKVGEKVTLKWKVTGATLVSIDHGVGNVGAEGSQPVVPTEVIATEVLPVGRFPIYLARYTLSATNSSGTAIKEVTVEVEPKSREEIFKLYQVWGYSEKTRIWPDGTEETQPLVGPVSSGALNNFIDAATGGDLANNRFNCISMQYKTLVFLNELKKQGVLLGWDYMPVTGPKLPYPQHNAVVMWPQGTAYDRTGEILDPHGKQEPDSYLATEEFTSGLRDTPNQNWTAPAVFTSWEPDPAYNDVYPGIGYGTAYNQGGYMLDNFQNNPENIDRWGGGSAKKTPWDQSLRVPMAGDYDEVVLRCPVDVLITNLAGQRLGVLPDGQWVAEFYPLDSYYWIDDNGDKQWFFLLPKDTYQTSITGTGMGNFHLSTYSSGGEVQDYGENPIASGEQATLNIDPQNGMELILADGQTVIPQSETIETFIASEQVDPGSRPGPGTLSEPYTEPEPGTEPEPTPYTFNFIPIIMAMAGVVVVAVTVGTIRRRRAARAGATNTVTASRTKAPPPPAASAKRPESPAAGRSRGRGVSCGKCDYQNPAGAEFCTKCGAVLEAMPATKACPECGDPIAEDEKFCNKCGAKVKAVSRSKFCSKCGDPIAEDENFCNKCGAKVKTGSRPKFCSKCGDPIAKGENFCDKCGAKQV